MQEAKPPQSDIHNKALLVGIELPQTTHFFATQSSLQELKELAQSAGFTPVAEIQVRLKGIKAATLLGKGNLEKIKNLASIHGVSSIIFDEELKPLQHKNLTEFFSEQFYILDRTALILDIFAKRAHTQEGKLQVQLARYTYLLPRLTRRHTDLAQQTGGRHGGVGLRGPGETQLEIERRSIKERMQGLKKEIEKIRRNRGKLRQKRREKGLFTVALAGYTNAGKSTLLNALAKASVSTESKLFCTLDPTTRRLKLPGGSYILLTDTVGFIAKLPHELITAFHATFEEITEADLILHVIDSSDPQLEAKKQIVEQELNRLALHDVPVVEVYNKIDLLKPESKIAINTKGKALYISALKGYGLAELRYRLEEEHHRTMLTVKLRLPYRDIKLLALLRSKAVIKEEITDDKFILIKAYVHRAIFERIKSFITTE